MGSTEGLKEREKEKKRRNWGTGNEWGKVKREQGWKNREKERWKRENVVVTLLFKTKFVAKI